MNDTIKPSFTGEVMLAGWQETHNGGAKITFWLPEETDLDPFRRMTVRKGKVAGQRFMCVLVEIGDDEKPANQAPAGHKRPHLSSDAHLMVTGDAYIAYVRETVNPNWDAERIRRWVKWQIGIESLSELDSDAGAAAKFHKLIRAPFAEWNEGREYDADGSGGLAED